MKNFDKIFMKIKLFTIMYCAFSLIFISNAQSSDDKNQDTTETSLITESGNVLNGHRFISSSKIKSPFINTYLLTSIGAGKTGRLDFPIIINEQELTTLTGDLAFTYFGFEYQHAVKDWIAFSLRINAIGRLGTDAGAVLYQGVDLDVGYQLGWLLKLYKSKDMMLSGTVKVTNNSFTLIDINGFIQGIVDSGKITPENKMVKNTPTTNAGAGLAYAYTINRMFGITAEVNFNYGESAERFSEDEWIFNYGIFADADLNPDYSVPLGFGLSYFGSKRGKNTTSLFGDPQNILFQINYTGKSDLDLGLVFNYQWYKDATIDQTINFTNVFMDIKYYF
ncbi:MAG: hypothetical protein MUF28_10895 [Ignavibacterium sp.]|nr:hypothetical protein [Ignavibacterium sp.]